MRWRLGGTVGAAEMWVACMILTAALAACLDEPSGPDSLRPTVPPVVVPPVIPPDLTGPSRAYRFVDTRVSVDPDTYAAVANSHYVIYDNGFFTLRNSGAQYTLGDVGIYATMGEGLIRLTWALNSDLPPDYAWVASATLTHDTLTVFYPTTMGLEGYVDAVYMLAP